jgi:8-oxo-dGTP diphosphatase
MADRHLVDVHILIIRDDQVLLTRRRDTDLDFNGRWHLPSGKLDAGESVLAAVTREAEEEVGVVIDTADLRHVHTMHVNGSGREPRLGIFFETKCWIGGPINREPDKCSAIGWFALSGLPDQLIAYSADGIHAYRKGLTFSVQGWPTRAATVRTSG